MTRLGKGNGQKGKYSGWSEGSRRELRDETGRTVGCGRHRCLAKNSLRGNGSPGKLMSFGWTEF